MKKIQNFECEECKKQQERLVKDSVKTVECVECGSKCNKMLSSPRYLGNTVGRSPALK